MKINRKLGTLCAALVIAGGVVSQNVNTASAQGPGSGPGHPGIGAELCSTTDYTEVVAKALGITAAELRVAVVSGKTVAELATSKNVTLDTVRKAVLDARKADIEAAYKAGLLTEAEYNARLSRLTAEEQNPRDGQRGLFIPVRNSVNPLTVAAEALGMTCADLVKAMETGQSIARVAASKSVEVQKVIDALTAAHKAALDKDVSEGLITKAQADGQAARLVEEIPAFVYGIRFGGQPGGNDGRRDGPGDCGPGGGRGPGRPGGPGGDQPPPRR